ncbi:MAG: LL-diaminopimelate aminotransferase [Thermodesulfobacteriota bacterium]|nr:LL-diaminopimelate aminotransferase [Thermodesulfobacteriota bacterium]
MTIEPAKRVKDLPPYLFAKIDKMRAEVISKGVDVINLSIGDPDLPTFPHIIKKMKQSIENPANHKYPSYEGMLSFRESVAGWYKRRFNVNLDPETEVLSLIGSKEGIAHTPLAFVDPGDLVLVPDPCYPVYPTATKFAGGIPYFLTLLERNHFFPDIKNIPEEVLKKSRLIFLNYPNNPTAAMATREFFAEIIAFAKKYNIIVCHDAAYTELYFEENNKPISFLEIEGAKEVGIEFHSLSKTYNMTGWRIGFAAGNSDAIQALGKIKTNIDSGLFQAIQEAGIEALESDQTRVYELRNIYKTRRDELIKGLKQAGFEVNTPFATFYVWLPNPPGYTSEKFTSALLSDCGIVTTPGNGFGSSGEGYIRIALTVDVERIKEAVYRIKKAGF